MWLSLISCWVLAVLAYIVSFIFANINRLICQIRELRGSDSVQFSKGSRDPILWQARRNGLNFSGDMTNQVVITMNTYLMCNNSNSTLATRSGLIFIDFLSSRLFLVKKIEKLPGLGFKPGSS